jgi:hypothetical protein
MRVLSYQMNYPHLKAKTKVDSNNDQSYMASLIMNIVNEIKRGFVPRKIFKATRSGTKVTFVKFNRDNDKCMEYFNAFNELLKKFNNDFNADVPLLELTERSCENG